MAEYIKYVKKIDKVDKINYKKRNNYLVFLMIILLFLDVFSTILALEMFEGQAIEINPFLNLFGENFYSFLILTHLIGIIIIFWVKDYANKKNLHKIFYKNFLGNHTNNCRYN